jgi:hypothetical protein
VLAQIVDRRLVDPDEPGAGPRLDAHVADRHTTLHREVGNGLAPVLDDVSGAAARSEARHDCEDDVLGAHPGGDAPVDGHRHRAGALVGQCLGRQHVFHLARADAERQGAERAVGGGVRVAAHDRHARLSGPKLGADDVDDPLVLVAAREQGDAEFAAVLVEGLELAS